MIIEKLSSGVFMGVTVTGTPIMLKYEFSKVPMFDTFIETGTGTVAVRGFEHVRTMLVSLHACITNSHCRPCDS